MQHEVHAPERRGEDVVDGRLCCVGANVVADFGEDEGDARVVLAEVGDAGHEDG